MYLRNYMSIKLKLSFNLEGLFTLDEICQCRLGYNNGPSLNSLGLMVSLIPSCEIMLTENMQHDENRYRMRKIKCQYMNCEIKINTDKLCMEGIHSGRDWVFLMRLGVVNETGYGGHDWVLWTRLGVVAETGFCGQDWVLWMRLGVVDKTGCYVKIYINLQVISFTNYLVAPLLAKKLCNNIQHIMPRKSKQLRLQYDPKALENAVAAVKAKVMSIRKAAKHYDVPRSTIGDRISGRVKEGTSPGKKPVYPIEVENQVAEKIKQAARMGFGITRAQLDGVTVLACINAAGDDIPPLVIVKGLTEKAVRAYNVVEGPVGTKYTYQKKAWMEDILGVSWFKDHFLAHCGRERPQIIILDSHSSHKTVGLIETYTKTVISTNIKKGFEVCGIYPFDPTKIKDSAFAPSVPFVKPVTSPVNSPETVSPANEAPQQMDENSVGNNIATSAVTNDAVVIATADETGTANIVNLDDAEVLLDLITSGKLNILQCDENETDSIRAKSETALESCHSSSGTLQEVGPSIPSNIFDNSWSEGINNVFDLPVSSAKQSNTKLNKKKLTSHRLLTSDEVYTRKKLEIEEKEKIAKEKEERKLKRQQKMEQKKNEPKNKRQKKKQ
ncbi:hypothetical protein KUTeg_016872 [Tegillarca granosa]|uniref:HTH psq-type domain-containing protein n=1 Tax=Tegillarca granosa TaxID=220873 RepID=A0ABQ9ERY7_TEGGR|nr:hypothetical protein KUTeg_016872 [Tegillarca granosa]